MSKNEKTPNITTDKGIVGQEYSNGAQHWYGVDDEGRKTHISEDKMLEAYGYGKDDFPPKLEEGASGQPELTEEVPTTPPETPPTDGGPSAEFNPWVKLGEVMKEVGGDLAQKEASSMLASLLEGDAQPLIDAGIPKEFIDGTLRKKLIPDIENQMRLAELGELDHTGYIPSSELNQSVMDLIVELAKKKVEGKMPNDELEYYDGVPAEEDEADDETPPEPPTSPELNSEHAKELSEARDAYAKLTAKRRGELLNSSKEELEAAKQRYEDALRLCGEDAQKILQELGLEADEIKSLAVDSLIREQTRLQSMIRDERESMSEGKKLARVYAWFGRQSGFKGSLKKALALGVVGLPIGVLAGTLGVAVFGPFGGAIAGAGLARGVTRGLTSAKINKESTAITHAEAQKIQDVIAGAEAIKAYMDEHDGSLPTAEDITRIVEERTKEQLHSGRTRTAKFATAGALFGALGAIGGHYINEHFFGGPKSTGIAGPTEPTAPKPPVVPVEPTPKPPIIPVEPTPTAPVVPVEPIPEPTPPVEVITPSFENYQYPWNWAVEQVGAPQAKDFLESLAQKAAQAGHTVEWHNMNTPNQWLEIDGLSDTKSVLEILNTYRG